MERIRRHYARMGLDRGWSKERFCRLCQLLHCTAEELAALCCIEERHLAMWLRRGRFPAHVSLHFELMEEGLTRRRGGRGEEKT